LSQVVSDRDPRRDPRRGDVLFNGRQHFYVIGCHQGIVTYSEAPPVEALNISVEQWRQFSTNDDVVKIGTE
jgi:hypothetical protein